MLVRTHQIAAIVGHQVGTGAPTRPIVQMPRNVDRYRHAGGVHRTADMALDEYIAANRELTDRLVYATRMPGVRLALTVSGGAAVYPRDARHGPIEDNPYGYLKREAEHRLARAAAKRGAGPVV